MTRSEGEVHLHKLDHHIRAGRSNCPAWLLKCRWSGRVCFEGKTSPAQGACIQPRRPPDRPRLPADLDATSRRALAVLRPLRVVITNLPDSHFEEVEAKVCRCFVAGDSRCGTVLRVT